MSKLKSESGTRKSSLSTTTLPFETEALRAGLHTFLEEIFKSSGTEPPLKVGVVKWGVYAFYDYDGEPIYVGQTNERLSTRIRQHLTNRRTDAVAMSVLDPFEVCEIEVWPLVQYQSVANKGNEAVAAKKHLDQLEFSVFQRCLEKSVFKAILNEKSPPVGKLIKLPPSVRKRIVGEHVSELRDHPDLRIARRAAVMARLAQIISERKVAKGLRRALFTQAERLRWLTEKRLELSNDTAEDDSDE